MNKLPGNYIAGFVDGEGCFSLKYRIDKKINKGNGKMRQYFYWGVEFAIVLRADDFLILEQIKTSLECGNITNARRGEQVRYSVQNTRDVINKVIPFFNKYQLRAKKSNDFALWSEAVVIINKYKGGILNVKSGQKGFIKKNMSVKDSDRLLRIRDAMIQYKSERSANFKWGILKE